MLITWNARENGSCTYTSTSDVDKMVLNLAKENASPFLLRARCGGKRFDGFQNVGCLQVNDKYKPLADDDAIEELKPLTAQEAAAWRASQAVTSPWRVLWLQALVGAVLVAFTAIFTSKTAWVVSVAWGVLSVWVPALVFARALARQGRHRGAGSALLGFFVWELVKIVLTVALLLVAPRVVPELSWAAMVAGFVITLKVYWLAMMLNMRQRLRSPQV